MIRGRCLCGTVTFEAEGPPRFSCHCHCAWCRRAHGAAFVTWLGLDERTFTFTAGKDEVVWYASSPESRRGFCRTCGTTLLFASELAPGEIHVALACLERPEDYPPTVHVFWDAHVTWNAVGDALPKKGRETPALLKYSAIARAPG